MTEPTNLTEPTNPTNPFAEREVPQWFRDAKLGIFIHWTPASVPAFAPLTDDPFTLADQHGWAYAMAHSPYCEWYQNSLAIPGSPVAEYHQRTYGDRPYAAFIDDFTAEHAKWQPNDWASTFAATKARYVVLVTKHHDGYTLWPSDQANPAFGERWSATRDLVGELGRAVRHEGMKWGTYYSGGLDWTFGGLPIDSFEAMLDAIPDSPEYAEYCENHWHELIDREQPDIIWNDIHHARAGDVHRLFAYYYDRVPDGVVNDRFDIRGVRKSHTHADFVTPEYRLDNLPTDRMWEICRGIGRSFGYNHLETDADYLSADDLVWMFIDIVARGGNLLLNVGPKADGTIPVEQLALLLALGEFNAQHEAAIFGSRPAVPLDQVGNAHTAEGFPIRFTIPQDGATHAFVRVPTNDTRPDATRMVSVTFPDGSQRSRPLGPGNEAVIRL
jgi:alpha-L-fucosidase